MHPRRLTFILGTAAFARGMELEDGKWTVSVWLNPSESMLGKGKPDLVFPTLLRNFDQAFALVAISVRDHLREAQAGHKLRPAGIYESEARRPEISVLDQ